MRVVCCDATPRPVLASVDRRIERDRGREVAGVIEVGEERGEPAARCVLLIVEAELKRTRAARGDGRMSGLSRDEDRKRACDTSILYNTRRHYRLKHQKDFRVTYGDLHARQIVDWKSPGEQMNTYRQISSMHRSVQHGTPFDLLKGLYPDQALEAMREHYR